MDPTEEIVLLLMWYRVFHSSGAVHLALDHVTTLLPAALLLLRDITAVAEMVYLPSY
jgi:hypothetical protein